MTNAAAAMVASPRLSIETLRGLLLWLMGFAGAFVFIEPSPYEIVGALAIAIFALTGLKQAQEKTTAEVAKNTEATQAIPEAAAVAADKIVKKAAEDRSE